jgi:16S rRNA (cytosine967-C5)-methyltransferase
VHCADAREPGPWQREQGFDRILVDAPCSGTGILRRQPDIRLLRQAGELAKLTTLQGTLLRALFPQLKAGGRLVYCTCSVLPEEGEAVVAEFVAETPEARALSLPESFGLASGPGRQGLPTRQGPDGFFYAVIEKVPTP